MKRGDKEEPAAFGLKDGGLGESHDSDAIVGCSSSLHSVFHDREEQVTLQGKEMTKGDLSVHSLRGKLYSHRGALYSLISSFFFAVQSVLIRYVQDDVHIMEVSFVRYLVMCIAVVPFLCYKKISVRPESRKVCLLHLTRGSLGAVSFNLFYYAILFMRAGDATAIVQTNSAFVGIFARVFLKEAFAVLDVVLVAVSVVGVFLISQPPFIFGGDQSDSLDKKFIGSLFALATSIGFALSIVTQSYMGKLKVNSSVILFYYGVIGTVGTAGITTVLGGWSYPPCFGARVALLAISVFHCAAQYLLTYSLSIELAVVVAIIQANSILFAYLLEFLLFGTSPELIASLGVILVMGASVTVSLRKVPAVRKVCSSQQKQADGMVSLDAESREAAV